MKTTRQWLGLLLLLLCGACSQREAGLREYHEALALMEQGDAPSALQQLQRASELAGTDSLRALVQSQMGTLYFSQRLLDRSLDCYRRALAIDSAACDTVGLIYDLRDIGNVLRATDDRADSCVVYFERARRLAAAVGNLPMQRDVESQLAAYHLYRNHLPEARRLLLPAMQYADADSQSGLLFMLADLYHRGGQRDSAAICYRQLLTRGNLYTRRAAHRVLAEYCIADGLAAEALHHLERYEQLTDSVHQQNDAEAMRRTAALYDYSQREQQAHRLRQHLVLAVSGVLVLLLLLLSVLLYFSRRRLFYRLKVERLEQLLARYRAQTAQAEQATPAVQDPTATLGPTAAEQIADAPICQTIDRLLNDTQPKAMDDDDFHQLTETVEQFYPAFLARLQEFCRLTPQERRVCLLVKLGLAPAAIAQLTAHSRQSVTNTRSRLFRKTFGRAGTPAEWDEFVRSL